MQALRQRTLYGWCSPGTPGGLRSGGLDQGTQTGGEDT